MQHTNYELFATQCKNLISLKTATEMTYLVISVYYVVKYLGYENYDTDERMWLECQEMDMHHIHGLEVHILIKINITLRF